MRGVKAAQQQLHPSTKSPETSLPFPPGLSLGAEAVSRDVLQLLLSLQVSSLRSRGKISDGDKKQPMAVPPGWIM